MPHPSFEVPNLRRPYLPALFAAVLALASFGCGGGDDQGGGVDDGGSGGNGASGGKGGSSTIPIGGTNGSGNGGGSGTNGTAGSSGTGTCGSNLEGRIRDFSVDHPDFEYELGDDRGIVEDVLGADGKPVYAHGDQGTATTTNADNFNQWYNDVTDVNRAMALSLPFQSIGGGVFSYENSEFFPIDGQLLGDEGNQHNYHFTFELHTTFVYNGGETFRFRGDDDVFAYINGHLVIDLGGVHTAEDASVDLDVRADELGITIGGEYHLDFFFAERHTSQSNFRIDTSIVFKDCGSGGEPA
jgi:fibro-slime domain-containing protein